VGQVEHGSRWGSLTSEKLLQNSEKCYPAKHIPFQSPPNRCRSTSEHWSITNDHSPLVPHPSHEQMALSTVDPQLNHCRTQARREGGVEGVSYPGPRDIWGIPPSARNIKYTRMYHFEKKNSKVFFPEGPRENVWGPSENVSLDPAVALDRPGGPSHAIGPTGLYWYRDSGLGSTQPSFTIIFSCVLLISRGVHSKSYGNGFMGNRERFTGLEWNWKSLMHSLHVRRL